MLKKPDDSVLWVFPNFGNQNFKRQRPLVFGGSQCFWSQVRLLSVWQGAWLLQGFEALPGSAQGALYAPLHSL